MTSKELAANLSKFHQAMECYGQAEGAQWEQSFSIPLNANAARIETYLDYLAHPGWSVLNKMARIDIENYKTEAVKRFRRKLTQFMKEGPQLPVRTEKLCSKLLSELDHLD